MEYSRTIRISISNIKRKLEVGLIFLLIVSSCPTHAETISELDHLKQEKSGQVPIEKRSEGGLEINQPGFSSREEKSFNQQPVDVVISGLAGGNPYENVLVLQVTCQDSFPLQIPYKYKDIIWSFASEKGSDSKVKTLQTDGTGKAVIYFTSKGSVNGQIIFIKLGEKKFEINLGKGPYEFNLPVNSCKIK